MGVKIACSNTSFNFKNSVQRNLRKNSALKKHKKKNQITFEFSQTNEVQD